MPESPDRPGWRRWIGPALLALAFVLGHAPLVSGAFPDNDSAVSLLAAAGLADGDATAFVQLTTSDTPRALRFVSEATWFVDFLVYGHNAAGYFVTCGLLHLALVFVVYGIVARITGSAGAALLAAALCAFDTTVHMPCHRPSSRAALLATLVSAVAVWIWPWARAHLGRVALVAMVWVAACFAKVIALPTVLILMAYERLLAGPRDQTWPRLIARGWPFVPAAALVLVPFFWVFSGGEALGEPRSVGATLAAVPTGLLELAKLTLAPLVSKSWDVDEVTWIQDGLRFGLLATLGVMAARTGAIHWRLLGFGVTWAVLGSIIVAPFMVFEEAALLDGHRHLLFPSVGVWIALAALVPAVRATSVTGLVAATVCLLALTFGMEEMPRLAAAKSGSRALIEAVARTEEAPHFASNGQGSLYVARARPDTGIDAFLPLVASPRFVGSAARPTLWAYQGKRQWRRFAGGSGIDRPEPSDVGPIDLDALEPPDVLLVETLQEGAWGGLAPAFRRVDLPLRPQSPSPAAKPLSWRPMASESGWHAVAARDPWAPVQAETPSAEVLAHAGFRARETARMLSEERSALPPILVSPSLDLDPGHWCGLTVRITGLETGTKDPDDPHFGLVVWSEDDALERPLEHSATVFHDGRGTASVDLARTVDWRTRSRVRRLAILPSNRGEPVEVVRVELRPCR